MGFAVLNNSVPEQTIKTLVFFFHSGRETDMLIFRVSVQPHEPKSTDVHRCKLGLFQTLRNQQSKYRYAAC